ncbi:MAG: MFS transporter [Betaproteobacteria bacterium]|jgi:MFS family permease|nr:MFS transporter [Betaproteobacteria bacterium]
MSLLRYPWALVGMLWFVAFLNAADRSILVAVLPQLRSELNLDNTQLALINSVFFWVYALCCLVSGRLGDAYSRRWIIILGLVFWSVATGLMPLATGFGLLLAMRALVAAGESTYYPSATALISDWHRPEMRSRALSLHQTGVFAGAGLGAYSAGLMADRYGWPAPFIVFAALGLVVAVALYFGLRERVQTLVPPAPVAPTDTAAQAEPTGRDPYLQVLSSSGAVALCVVFFLATGASSGLMVWAPTYIYDKMGTNLAQSALLGSATINLAGFLSVPVGGWLADKLALRVPSGRFWALAIGLTAAALCLLALPWAQTTTTIAVVLVASSLGKGLFDGCIYSAMHDVMPSRSRATAVGLMTTCGFLGAGVTPILVARLSESWGMASGLAGLALLYALAVLLLVLMDARFRRIVLAHRKDEAPGEAA